MKNSPPVVWKFKKWQDRKNMVEKSQQLKYMFITEEQKSYVSVHTEGITEGKNHAILVYFKMECIIRRNLCL